MRLPLFCLLSLFLLAGCDGETRNRRAARGTDFVSDPDHLFFLNTRARDYRSLTLEEGVDMYYHDGIEGSEIVIVDRWIDDRALLKVDGKEVGLKRARTMRDSLRRLDRSAALEVVEDYLRLVSAQPN